MAMNALCKLTRYGDDYGYECILCHLASYMDLI
jgi:hypothetical protein